MYTNQTLSTISAPTGGKPLVATPTSSTTQKRTSEETKSTVVSASVTKSIMAKSAEGKKKGSPRETDEVDLSSNQSATLRVVADRTAFNDMATS
jgi:hypothetical protein